MYPNPSASRTQTHWVYSSLQLRHWLALVLATVFATGERCQAEQQKKQPPATGSVSLFNLSQSLKDPIRVHPSIYQAQGVSNTFLVTTPEGNVIIDTTLAQLAPLHKLALSRVSTAPVK